MTSIMKEMMMMCMTIDNSKIFKWPCIFKIYLAFYGEIKEVLPSLKIWGGGRREVGGGEEVGNLDWYFFKSNKIIKKKNPVPENFHPLHLAHELICIKYYFHLHCCKILIFTFQNMIKGHLWRWNEWGNEQSSVNEFRAVVK